MLGIPAIRGNSLYTIVGGPSWTEAEANARNLGGNLVTINNEDENDFVLSQLSRPAHDLSRGGSWIGLNADLDGNWSWSSGDNVTYNNFAPGQGLITDYRPHIGANSVDGQYAHIVGPKANEVGFIGESAGEWNDMPNNPTIDITWGSQYEINSGTAEVPLNLSIDASDIPKEGSGVFTTSIYLSAGSETTGNLADGVDVYWQVSGINADDLSSGELAGSGVITNGKLSIEHSLVNDDDSGESLKVSVFSDVGKSQQIGTTAEFLIEEKSGNTSPTDLSISASTFDENKVRDSAVATLSTSDPDSGDTFTYSLASGSGDTDNSAFTIDGDQLQINASPDYETQESYSIRLQTTDSGGLTFEKSFTLSVNDLDEGAPDVDGDGFVDGVNNYQMWTSSGGIDLTNKKGRKFSDDTSKKWDAIKAIQTDSGFSILLRGDGKKQGKFQIVSANEKGVGQYSSSWKTASQMFESGYEDIFDTDFNGNSKIGFIAPVMISLSTFSFYEKISSGSVVSNLSSTDLDPDDTHTYSLVSGSGDTDNSAFSIKGDKLKINASPDYETQSSYSIRLKTTDSSGGLSFERPFTLSVYDLDGGSGPYDLNFDGFVDLITNYQVLTNTGGVDLVNKKGKKYSDKSSRKWDAVKAITDFTDFSDESSIGVLISGSGKKDNKFKMWSANLESGLVTTQTKWKNEPWMIKQGYEEIFQYDINDNGVIGS